MAAHREYLWTNGALRPVAERAAGAVVASDSWLLSSGSVLALDVHRDRFLRSIEAGFPERLDEASEFWSAAMLELPLADDWFPRLELATSADRDALSGPGQFRLALRPAPERSASLALVTASSDPRREPLVKGPDLARLEALREEARAQGADEAVILSSDGFVVEGDYTSLVWWRGDALCVVDDDLPRLPGVTERSLVTLATALGIEILRDKTEPDGLEGLEVWALNSLHGARIATRWPGGPTLAERPGRLRLWRTRLAALRKPVR